MDTTSADGSSRAEVVERSASHFLTRDLDGWALWGVDQDSDDPLLTFAADEAGEDRARAAFRIRSRETRRVRWLGVVAVVAGVVWIAVATTDFILERMNEGSGFDTTDEFELRTLIQSLDFFARTVFEVSVGLYLVAWLARRWRREG